MTCCKIFAAAAVLAAAVFSSGCGYKIGARSLMHPQVKSIAVAEVKNDTLEMLASSVMRQQLCERFQFDGGLKLKNLGASDCVLYGRITKVSNMTIREDSKDNDITYRPAEFQLSVTFEFSVLIPGRGEPLISPRSVVGTATYQILADPAVSRANALKQACLSAAKLAVEYTTEAW